LLFNIVERTTTGCSYERSGVEKLMCTIPQHRTLDGFVETTDKLEGVTLKTLKPCDMIHTRTLNSDYEIFLLDPESGLALVRGGKYFAEPREAIVSGSNFGGSMLKLGWLGRGLSMELSVNGDRIATSPIIELRVEPESIGSDQSVIDLAVSQ
jgi:hypothetical protein